MLKSLHVGNFSSFMVNFERVCTLTQMLFDPPPQGADQKEILHQQSLQKYREALSAILATCKHGEIPISYPVKRQLEAFYERLDQAAQHHVEYQALAEHARLARQSLIDDLSQHLFVCIPAEKRELLEQPDPPFGQSVSQRFDKARRDIAASCRCLAFEEWTACVFHSMRVLEYGLRELAARIDLPADAMEQENWKNVIDQIEAQIRAMEKLPKSAAKAATLKTYSEAALHFRYFKDAWRNYVSHTNEPSDERDASSVWSHVKEFVQQLAETVAADD